MVDVEIVRFEGEAAKNGSDRAGLAIGQVHQLLGRHSSYSYSTTESEKADQRRGRRRQRICRDGRLGREQASGHLGVSELKESRSVVSER